MKANQCPQINTVSAPPIHGSPVFPAHTHKLPSCPAPTIRLSLLLGHTDGATAATGRLGVLAADTEAPVVSQTAVSTDLLEALQIVTELAVNAVGQDLGVLAVDDVALPVKEPGGDLVCELLARP